MRVGVRSGVGLGSGLPGTVFGSSVRVLMARAWMGGVGAIAAERSCRKGKGKGGQGEGCKGRGKGVRAGVRGAGAGVRM